MRLFPKQELARYVCLTVKSCFSCKRAGGVGVNAIKHCLKRLWLVAIATILSKTFKIHFLFMSAIAHNWSFFTKLNQTFWSIYRVHSTLRRFFRKFWSFSVWTAKMYVYHIMTAFFYSRFRSCSITVTLILGVGFLITVFLQSRACALSRVLFHGLRKKRDCS